MSYIEHGISVVIIKTSFCRKTLVAWQNISRFLILTSDSFTWIY